MRRCLVVLLLMFIITGCGNIDLSMGPIDPQLGDSSAAASIEDGDPFDYVEYEGASIPVLTEPLPVNELFYLRSWMNEEYPDYKMVPKHLLAKSGCLLSSRG